MQRAFTGYSRADEVTAPPAFADLVLPGLKDDPGTHSKDIISKPQFVISFQRDVDLLLYSDIVDECL